MLKLSNDQYIAEGKTKVCYQHPLDSSKVIKINSVSYCGNKKRNVPYKIGNIIGNLIKKICLVIFLLFTNHNK